MHQEPRTYRTEYVHLYVWRLKVRENGFTLAWMGIDDDLDGAVLSCVLYLSALYII